MKKEIFTNLSRRASYIRIYYSTLIKIYTEMAKKRKLNSKNPRYWSKDKIEGPKIKKRVHSCDAAIRTATGKKTGRTAAVYAIFYEN